MYKYLKNWTIWKKIHKLDEYFYFFLSDEKRENKGKMFWPRKKWIQHWKMEKLCNFFICTIRANTNVILTEEWSREQETGDKFQRGILISSGEA